MPPKGWRKNADGSYPQPAKDMELKSIDEILFPRSLVQRLAKEITNSDTDNMNMAKDSLLALQRSATVFVSHLLFHAKSIAAQSDRKHVNAQDVIVALERAEYSGFVPAVKQKLLSYEAAAEAKKTKKALEKSSVTGESDAKRLKSDNTGADKEEVDEEDEDADEIEEEIIDSEGDMNNDETEEVQEDSNIIEEEAGNPISAISKEEEELEGATIEEAVTIDDDADKSSDEE